MSKTRYILKSKYQHGAIFNVDGTVYDLANTSESPTKWTKRATKNNPAENRVAKSIKEPFLKELYESDPIKWGCIIDKFEGDKLVDPRLSLIDIEAQAIADSEKLELAKQQNEALKREVEELKAEAAQAAKGDTK